MNKTPAVRFKGFTKDWEQRKLEDISDVRDGTHDSPVYQDEGHPFVTSKNVKNGYINFDGIQYISDYDFFEINKRSKVDINDILMGMIGTIGNLALIRTEPNFAIKNVALIKDTKNVSYLYLYHYLKSSNIERQLLFGMDGGTQKFVSLKKIRELKIQIPDDDEQIKLGTFMESLDNLIVFYQRKYEKLVNIKKSMLYKMFPQNGSKVPEIRFTGFTDDWEQRKLSEIATMHARIGWQNLRKSEFLNSGDYYLITGTDFVDGEVDLVNCHYVTKDRYDQDPNIQIENGSILITKDGTLGKVAYVKGLEKPATLNAGVFNVLIREKKRVYGKYLFQYLKAPFLLDYVAKKATGGTIKHLNQEILVDFPVVLPKYDEQVLLGDTFENIDNLITLHHRKLEKLKQLKQAMLHKMFV